jgi:urease beta subunit
VVGGDRQSQAAAHFTLLQEELELRLEAQKAKGKAQAIAIESAERTEIQ